MRRWLTILLLVMLPLQFSWAAAAAYCEHETSASARHVGHHEHEHQAGVDDTPAGASAEKASNAKGGEPAADNDCGYCHLSAAKPLQVQPLEVPAVAGLAAHAAPVHPLQTRGPDRRERPNWRLA